MVRRDLSCAFFAAGKVSLTGAADVRPWLAGEKMGTDGPDDGLYGGYGGDYAAWMQQHKPWA